MDFRGLERGSGEKIGFEFIKVGNKRRGLSWLVVSVIVVECGGWSGFGKL